MAVSPDCPVRSSPDEPFYFIIDALQRNLKASQVCQSLETRVPASCVLYLNLTCTLELLETSSVWDIFVCATKCPTRALHHTCIKVSDATEPEEVSAKPQTDIDVNI